MGRSCVGIKAGEASLYFASCHLELIYFSDLYAISDLHLGFDDKNI
jgi:hypothetical protein